MQLRSRFMYPSADILTEVPRIDLALDALSAHLRRSRSPWAGEFSAVKPGRRFIAMGFPRSGNTFLLHWLSAAASDDVTVLDGRLTHSALDVHRFARRGIPVVVPIREPVPTVASWMVRSGKPDRIDAGWRKLRAYAAWQRVVTKALRTGCVVVVPFTIITEEPQALASMDLLRPMLTRKSSVSPELLRASLEVQLQNEPGQGRDLNGVPAAWMRSLPSEGRASVLSIAREVLVHPGLRRELQSARDARKHLIDRATRLGVLVEGSGGSSVEDSAPWSKSA